MMEGTGSVSLSRALRKLAAPLLVCDLLFFVLTPGLAALAVSPGELEGLLRYVADGWRDGYGLHNLGHGLAALLLCWRWVWADRTAALLTVCLWLLGGSAAAFLLWIRKRRTAA